MGGGTYGNFGKTKGSSLDAISNLLAAASLIPGVDTFADIAAIPVDIARGDWVSAGLDLVGVIPFVGEVADTAKIARVADKAVDAAKASKSVIKRSIKYPGNNPTTPPGKGFEWRGKSSPKTGKGNWYNPKTGEKWNADLKHGDPIGPHWDYTDSNGVKYRVFPDGRIEKK